MQFVRDYVAGRTEDVDALLDWVEQQTEPITAEQLNGLGNVPMLNECPSLKEISRQFWALLNPLVVNSNVSGTFANVERHTGFEAWRKLVKPINEDKDLLQKDILPMITNPKAAASMDRV